MLKTYRRETLAPPVKRQMSGAFPSYFWDGDLLSGSMFFAEMIRPEREPLQDDTASPPSVLSQETCLVLPTLTPEKSKALVTPGPPRQSRQS
jgi:hypothetical protein